MSEEQSQEQGPAPAPEGGTQAPREPVQESFGFTEIDKILSFDPFDGETKPAKAPAPPAAPEALPEKSATGLAPVADPGAPPAQPAPEGDSEKELLKQQLAQLQQQVAAARNLPQAPPRTQESKAKEAAPVPAYNFTIPDKLVDGLASEDPRDRQQALGALAQGLAQAIHTTIRQEYEGVLQAQMRQVPQMMQQQLTTQQQARGVFDDFYGKYPQLNNPSLYPVVVQTAQAVMSETGAAQWNAQLRDTVAQRVMGLLQSTQATAGSTVPKVNGQQPPPAMFGGRQSRGPVASTADSVAADVMDTLFGA